MFFVLHVVFRYLFTIDMIGVSQPDQTLEISLLIYVCRYFQS